MNVLGVCFDSKLTWSTHIANTINKAIKLIKKYFTNNEILQLLTSNFYSILYYNSEIWHLPSLPPQSKQLLLSASAKALKISQTNPDTMQSYANVHKECKRAQPNEILEYKHSILLHKIYNNHVPLRKWIELNF